MSLGQTQSILFRRWILCAAAGLLAAGQALQAQPGIVDGKTNLIVNGNAEAGPASPDGKAVVASIPGWTRGAGMVKVLPYGLTGHMLLSDPAPPDHAFQYFATASNGASTLVQTVDISSGAPVISGGNVKYTASAYLGNTACCLSAQVSFDFQDAAGRIFSNATLAVSYHFQAGMSLQQQIGLVPAGAVRVTVTLTLKGAGSITAVADSLSLVLTPLATNPSSVLGTNLVVNPGAEAGPSAPPGSSTTYIPGWSSEYDASVAPYGGTGWIAVSNPGPADRGVNLFTGGPQSDSYQDIDVSPAAALIDVGQVKYEVSAWLGGLTGANPTLTYTFFDWPGTQLAPTAQLGPATHFSDGLVQVSDSGILPPRTRRVHIALSLPTSTYAADNINFTLAAPSGPPVITAGGILSAGAFGGSPSIAPGSWIEIYGDNLTSATRTWSGSDFLNGVAPTKIGDVTVSVGGKPAFIDYISPGQVNALVPSDAPTGPVAITLTNSNGTSDPFGIYVNPAEPGLLAPPSYKVNGKQYVAALFPDGTYALPAGAIPGVSSHPAKPGDTLLIYGIGFGPVTGGFTAGTVVTGQNTLSTPVQIFFGAAPATLTYYGLAPSFTGLYQFDVVVPNVSPNAAMPISVKLGGAASDQTLYIAVQ